MAGQVDPQTLSVYAAQAKAYEAHDKSNRATDFLNPFLKQLPPKAIVLDLGCGTGWAGAILEQAGHDVYAIDACKEMAAIATMKLHRPVRICSFGDVTEQNFFDGIWASGAMLHVQKSELQPLLNQLGMSLKSFGLLCATFKGGSGERRDQLGRFYAYYEPAELRDIVSSTESLEWVDCREAKSRDFTGNETSVIGIMARSKPN